MTSLQYSICWKTRGGQQCFFLLNLTFGVNTNLEGQEAPEGELTPPTNRALLAWRELFKEGSSDLMAPYIISHILYGSLADRLHNTSSAGSSIVISYKNTISGGSSIM